MSNGTVLWLLRSSFKVRTGTITMLTTEQSMVYRRRAAKLARSSEATSEETEQLKLIQQALSWIQLAENEELIAGVDGKT